MSSKQGCQVRDFIPRSREYSGLLGFFSGICFGEKISGKFSGFLENRLEKFFRIDLLVTKRSYENKSGMFHSHFANHHSKVGFINRSEAIAKMGRKEANVKRVPKGNLVQLVKTMSKHLFK